MKTLLVLIISSLVASAQAATVMVSKNINGVPNYIFFDVSHGDMSKNGVEIYVGKDSVCLIESSFLESTNTSGLYLIMQLKEGKYFDYVIECNEQNVAYLIRPR